MAKEKLVGFLLRHGETLLNSEKKFRSWIDVPLDDNGIKQAKAAAKFLSKYPIKRVISSPLLRAFVTADICSNGNFVAQHRGLFPWRLGYFSGLPRDENEDALRLFVHNPDVAIPGGESLQDFEDRQYAFWKETLKSPDLTLYVAHTSNAVALLNFTQDKDQTEPEFGEAVEPGGIAAIYFDGKNHRLEVVFGGEKTPEFGGS